LSLRWNEKGNGVIDRLRQAIDDTTRTRSRGHTSGDLSKKKITSDAIELARNGGHDPLVESTVKRGESRDSSTRLAS
jgi:hypothetical protein